MTFSAMTPRDAVGGAGTDRLVGRDGQLARLDGILAGCRQGRPALVEVVGDPGTGKTRLLQEFSDRARGGGTAILGVSASNHEMVDSTILAILDGTAVSVVHREPLLADQVRDAVRHRFHGSGCPVLLLDNLHAATAGSLDLLACLLQVPPDGLLVVVAYRPRQLHPTGAAALAAATGMRRHLIEMTDLDMADVAAMLDLPHGLAAERVRVRTNGVPLYVRAFRPAAVDGSVVTLDGLPDELPADVLAAIRMELAELDDDQRRMAESVSVLDGSFDAGLAAVLSGFETIDAAELLDILVARDLLRTDMSDESALRFRHEVVRAVVYQSALPTRRQTLHHRAAAYLRELGGLTATYAEHLSRGARRGDVAAAETLVDAATSRCTRPATAVGWLSAARRLLPTTGEVGGLHDKIEINLAEALSGAGRLHDGRALLRELTYRPGAADCHRIRTLMARVTTECLLGRPFEGYVLASTELPRTYHPPRTRLLLEAGAAVAGVLCGVPAAADHAVRVSRIGAGMRDPTYRTVADTVAAFVAACADPDADLSATLDRASTGVDALPDAALACHLTVVALLAWTELLRERDHDALRHFDRALEAGFRAGRLPLIPYLLAGRGYTARRLGNLGQAQQDCLDAELAASAMGIDPLARLARGYRAIALAWQDGPMVTGPLVQATPSAHRRNWYDHASLRIMTRLRYELDCQVDSRALLRACGGQDLGWVEASSRPCWATILAEMDRRSGRLDEAARWLVTADRYARRLGLQGQQAHVTIGRARLCLHDDPALAATLADSATAVFADLGWRIDEAVARVVYARALCLDRRWAAAENQLGAARRIADLTGARTLRRMVASEQRRASGCAGRMTDSVLGASRMPALTRREWDIAKLVAAGNSNAEAAGHLYVTVKTVEAHLTRIFRKLGVSSRAGLAAVLAGWGDDDPPGGPLVDLGGRRDG